MKTVEWKNNTLELIDQTKLPLKLEKICCKTYIDAANCIKNMNVRGAPAIGVTAAYGMVLSIIDFNKNDKDEFMERVDKAYNTLKTTRPTAVNLFWALERMIKLIDNSIKKGIDIETIKQKMLQEAHKIAEEDVLTNKKIGLNGEKLVRNNSNILTHCNAGELATVEYGTALGIIYTAWEKGKKIHVYADETRPRLQGARITAWELKNKNIPVTLITDSMAAFLMKQGKIDMVIVGADRIASNGDTANKVGTYGLAVLCKHHNIPFYVAAPTSTIDFSIKTGKEIVIEERSPEEVIKIEGVQIAPNDINVYNPAFDITPHQYITAIITEKGIFKNINNNFRLT